MAAALVLLGCSFPARASLGGNRDSVRTDGAQLHASLQSEQHSAYSLQTMTLPGGTVVDEYLTSGGQVFAVTWRGPFLPPLQQILGQYFDSYSAALQSKPKVYGHRPLHMEQSGLVIESGGHMRSHFGRVYLSGQLPQGVTEDQIR